MDLRTTAPGLERDREGWWISPRVSAVSYPEEGNSQYFAVEDSSFWFAHRNRCILEALRLYPPPGALLDVGGGNGYVARAIQDSGWDVVLVEPGLAGVRNAVRRGIRHVVRATVEDAGFQEQSIPAVGLFDVVEHIDDDSGYLKGIHRLLTDGGRLYATVPAYPLLWSHEDVIAGHSRRYTISTLSRLLQQTGFEIEFATYLFGFLPAAILVSRVLPYRMGFAAREKSEKSLRTDHEAGHPLLAKMIEVLTRRELSKISRQRRLRWGSSCLTIARKRGAAPDR